MGQTEADERRLGGPTRDGEAPKQDRGVCRRRRSGYVRPLIFLGQVRGVSGQLLHQHYSDSPCSTCTVAWAGPEQRMLLKDTSPTRQSLLQGK